MGSRKSSTSSGASRSTTYYSCEQSRRSRSVFSEPESFVSDVGQEYHHQYQPGNSSHSGEHNHEPLYTSTDESSVASSRSRTQRPKETWKGDYPRRERDPLKDIHSFREAAQNNNLSTVQPSSRGHHMAHIDDDSHGSHRSVVSANVSRSSSVDPFIQGLGFRAKSLPAYPDRPSSTSPYDSNSRSSSRTRWVEDRQSSKASTVAGINKYTGDPVYWVEWDRQK